jgi:hypothetical protein
MSRPAKKLLVSPNRKNQVLLFFSIALVVLSIGLIGLKYQRGSHAATAVLSSEAEAGTVTAPATSVADTSASGGRAARFAAVTPPPPPPPPSGTMIGMYNGNPNEAPDAKFVSLFGKAPQLATTYITGQAINETYEKARLAAGTSIVFDLDPKDTPGLLYGVATQTTAGDTYINNFLAAAQRVAASSTKAKVYVTLAHEWEVKRAQNRWTDTRDADIGNYAKALSVFNSRAASTAPGTQAGYWTGGYSAHQTVLAQVMAAMTTPAKWVSADPYRTSGTQTLLQNWNGYGVDFFQANATYKAWGSPPIFITEYGINTDNISDATAAAWLTDIRGTMKAAGVSGSVYFNRDRPEEAANHMWKLDNGDTPQALGAFKASFLAP